MSIVETSLFFTFQILARKDVVSLLRSSLFCSFVAVYSLVTEGHNRASGPLVVTYLTTLSLLSLKAIDLPPPRHEQGRLSLTRVARVLNGWFNESPVGHPRGFSSKDGQ